MNKEKAIQALEELLNEAQNKIETHAYFNMEYGRDMIDNDIYDPFIVKVKMLLKSILKDENDVNIKKVATLSFNDLENLKVLKGILLNLKHCIENEYINMNNDMSVNINNSLECIFKNFHKVVKTLRNRYNNRTTIDVEDEYDVQDLLFAMLQIFFKDIRKEEWTPSYAGNSSRVDFLLKDEKIVIEVKKTRNTMKDKDLGDQLIIDITKYKSHPDCQKLICFVYDPEGRIVNPDGIINDLEGGNKDFVKIYINP